jgi:hypothetical protein
MKDEEKEKLATEIFSQLKRNCPEYPYEFLIFASITITEKISKKLDKILKK